MFELIATAITAARRLKAYFADKGITPATVQASIHAGEQLVSSIKAGTTIVFGDDGKPMTPAAFLAKLEAWETQQGATSAGAAGRIEARHQSDTAAGAGSIDAGQATTEQPS